MSSVLKLVAIAIIAVGLSSTTKAVELTGILESEDGKPLSGVQVLSYAPHQGSAELLGRQFTTNTKRYEVTSDANGFFKLPSHGEPNQHP